MDAGVGPALLPSGRGRPGPPPGSRNAVPSSGVFLAWPTLRSTLPLRSGSRDAAGQSDGAVVGEHVAVERIQRGIVDVGLEHAFAEIVEHDDASGAAEPAEGLLMQFGPDARAGAGR